MEADYGIELGPTAPALEIPWQDPAGNLHYVELRGVAGGRSLEQKIDSIPETRQFPALRKFLLDVNSQSAWQTAKCDVWCDETEAAENLYDAGFTQNCYVDIVIAEPAILRFSQQVHERAAKELAVALDSHETLDAYAEIVVRHCHFHRASNPEESDAGYCLTLFLIGYGSDPPAAAQCWTNAMELIARQLLKLQPQERAQGSELG
jgi:hypothetical protein